MSSEDGYNVFEPTPEETPAAALDDAPEEAPKKRRRGVVLPLVLSVLLIAGGVTLGIMAYVNSRVPENAIVDINGHVVVPDDSSATDPVFQQATDMTVDLGGDGFVIPAINMKVGLGAINDVDGVMNPPNFVNAFWVRTKGVSLDDAKSGTVYIVAHSTRFGLAPGNMVQDHESVKLQVGDPILANGVKYTFVSSEVIPQDDLNAHEDLWTNTPGRLIFVTCLLNNDNSAPNKNLVIIGKLAS